MRFPLLLRAALAIVQQPLATAVFTIRKVETLTSSLAGSGMDKPNLWFFGYSNGGTYSLQICDTNQTCCSTGTLNTEDNNWELGQTDWFVGRQLAGCNGFRAEGPLMLKLQHGGSNAGRLEYIRLHDWHTATSYRCPIDVRLDHSQSVTVECNFEERHADQDSKRWCNGRSELCGLRFDEFLFPGSHNSGTGQLEGYLQCASKNQDLNITEQLDFGIRFLDIDAIYSYNLVTNCRGLETGHGNMPAIGLYQCYGQISTMLEEIRVWLDARSSEVIVLDFGNLERREKTVPRLVEAIQTTFLNTSGVRLNTAFELSGEWPTLGEAVEENARVFAFVRDESITQEVAGIMQELRIKAADEVEGGVNKQPGQVSILSSYQARSVEEDCSFVLETTSQTCARNDTDLTKISLFSSFVKGGMCIHDMARLCNPLVSQALHICRQQATKHNRFKPNFVLLDYPNYQVTELTGFIAACEKENLWRAERKLRANS